MQIETKYTYAPVILLSGNQQWSFRGHNDWLHPWRWSKVMTLAHYMNATEIDLVQQILIIAANTDMTDNYLSTRLAEYVRIRWWIDEEQSSGWETRGNETVEHC